MQGGAPHHRAGEGGQAVAVGGEREVEAHRERAEVEDGDLRGGARGKAAARDGGARDREAQRRRLDVRAAHVAVARGEAGAPGTAHAPLRGVEVDRPGRLEGVEDVQRAVRVAGHRPGAPWPASEAAGAAPGSARSRSCFALATEPGIGGSPISCRARLPASALRIGCCGASVGT